MMELARSLLQSGKQPARNVVFAAWNGEESGLIGSCFHAQHPSFALESTRAAVALDQLGDSDGNGGGVYTTGSGDSVSSWLPVLFNQATKDAGFDYIVFPTAQTNRSDHWCWVSEGVAGTAIVSMGDQATYHTPADTAASVDIPALRAALDIVWSGLGVLATATTLPPAE